MSNQKTLSQLSFVVIALLAAALPCLAQTKSTQSRNNQTGDMSLRQGTEVAALGSERLNDQQLDTGEVFVLASGDDVPHHSGNLHWVIW